MTKPKTEVIEIKLPTATIKELNTIAKLAGCSVNIVSNVILAAYVLKQKNLK